MIADLPPSAPPPAEIRPAVPSGGIGIWGDRDDLLRMQVMADSRGWTYFWLALGEGARTTYWLVIEPGEKLSPKDAIDLLEQISAGRFGKLHAGYAMVGNRR